MTTSAVRSAQLETAGGSINKCARRFGISPERLRQAIREGELRAHVLHERSFYIFFNEVERWIRSLPSAEGDAEVLEARRVIARSEARARNRRARRQERSKSR